MNYPEPLPRGCKTANQSPNYSIYTHSRNFKVVKVEELTTGWKGDEYLTNIENQHIRALYAACKLEYIPDVDEVKKEGLWANINAKKKAGKKSSHKNSNAYKAAKKAGNALKQETKGAPAGHYFTKSGNLVKGRMTKDAKERGARLSDPKDKMRSKVPKVTQYTETSDPQDGKAAPYGSGYKKVTKEDIRNLIVGTIAEMQNENTLEEKDDRCTRLAKSKYDTWPSAYASGAVVRCRRGEIWKKK